MNELKENYMTREQVAESLRVDKRTLDRMRSRGEGPPHIKFGGRVLFKKSSVEAWMDALEVTPCRS